MEARTAELLEVPYFQVVFTLPPKIGATAYHNKAVIYDLLSKASAETMLTIAADPKRLGVKMGLHLGAAHVGLRIEDLPGELRRFCSSSLFDDACRQNSQYPSVARAQVQGLLA
jgi:hypothetical protein